MFGKWDNSLLWQGNVVGYIKLSKTWQRVITNPSPILEGNIFYTSSQIHFFHPRPICFETECYWPVTSSRRNLTIFTDRRKALVIREKACKCGARFLWSWDLVIIWSMNFVTPQDPLQNINLKHQMYQVSYLLLQILGQITRCRYVRSDHDWRNIWARKSNK